MPRKKIYQIPLKVVELEENNYHILISSTFKNKSESQWTIDTGASKTVIDANCNNLFTAITQNDDEVQSAGIGEGKIETSSGTVNSFKLNDAIINNFHVAVIDLSHVNKLYNQFANEKIVGLLGSDFLMKYEAVIDFKKQLLTIKA